MDQLLGLLILLVIASILAVVVLSVIIARQAVRPPRHTAGYAVARGLAVDPAERGLDFEEWILDLPDGAALPVWEVKGCRLSAVGSRRSACDCGPLGSGRQPIADGRQPPLTAIFVHAWGESRIDMLARVEPWLELCDRLVFYDLRGHGEAEGGETRLGDGDDQDLLALLERLGQGRFVLVGCGLGAVIAIDAATTAPPCTIAGVVAEAPYGDFHVWLRGRLQARDLPTRPFTDLALVWLRLRGIRPADATGGAQRLKCPLLVVCRDDDPLCSLDDAGRIADMADRGELCRPRDADELDEALMTFVHRLAYPMND
jgi:pimeloyl-ACP methyl ester carboxylesterase